jgi:signal peptidase I
MAASPAAPGHAPASPAAAPEAAKPPLFLRVWRTVWGTSPSPGQGQPTSGDGTREIVETVVFVVVLVLMLKSFTAEAFVIPTGSMAETLWGYQKVVACPECGYQFPVNCSQEVEPPPGRELRPVPVTGCTCPNCLLNIRLIPPNEPGDVRAAGQVPDPGANSGDRVLVAKFLYDLLGRHPDRLDVVVFKFPGNNGGLGDGERFPLSGPVKKGVPMNYIKRLIGLPGETILVFGGNLYASAPDLNRYAEADFKDCPDEESRELRRKMLWQREYTHFQVYSSGREEYQKILQDIRDGKYTIVRKPADKILSMRRIVFDNDHQPKDLRNSFGPHWQPAKDTWDAIGTSFRIDARADHSLGWLRYRHLRRDRGDKPYLITDIMGYNMGVPSQSGGSPGENWVGDLSSECEVTVDKPDGEVVLELSRGVDRFRASFNLADGFCTLYRVDTRKPAGTEPQRLDSKETRVKGKGTWHIRFANVDQALTVWVDGKLPFGENGVRYEAPDYLGPTENDLEPASIGSSAGVTVRKIQLWRDTYYTVGERQPSDPDCADAGVRLNDPETWGPLGKLPLRSMYVQPNHYLCLGDNSQASSDGRSWGLVPNRLLLGRALLVYYPFYFPWWPLSSPVNRVGLIH